LPAPFGPRKPSTSPRPTEKETPSTARSEYFGQILCFNHFVRSSFQRVAQKKTAFNEGGVSLSRFFLKKTICNKMFKKNSVGKTVATGDATMLSARSSPLTGRWNADFVAETRIMGNHPKGLNGWLFVANGCYSGV
jgi:hypothetical protein